MSITELEAYLGIPMPSIELLDSSEESRQALYATLDDLCECSGAIDFQFGAHNIKPEIELLNADARSKAIENHFYPDLAQSIHRARLDNCEIMRLGVSVPASCYYDTYSLPEGMSQQDARLLISNADFCKRISDLLVIANIGRLGSMELVDSALIHEGQRIYSSIPNMKGLAAQEAVKVAKGIGWPILRDIKCETAWNWASKRVSVLEGFDGTPIGRALAAFSRIFEIETADEPMQLLWALVGLEALYVKGKSELLNQVREKSQVLLGPQETYKKRISRMYEFRSRFVHGDLDFPGLCLIGDARDEFAKYGDEL